jgi:hypothetical protein
MLPKWMESPNKSVQNINLALRTHILSRITIKELYKYFEAYTSLQRSRLWAQN